MATLKEPCVIHHDTKFFVWLKEEPDALSLEWPADLRIRQFPTVPL